VLATGEASHLTQCPTSCLLSSDFASLELTIWNEMQQRMSAEKKRWLGIRVQGKDIESRQPGLAQLQPACPAPTPFSSAT
jgi:hypothetical protein